MTNHSTSDNMISNDSWGRVAAGGLLLLALAALAYLPALRGGPIWDDYDWIVDNPLLRSADGLRSIWLDPSAFHQYYPLTHTSFWLEYQRWGEQTLGYHAVNVVLHAGVAFLLWRILRRLALGGAFAAAVIFAVHPLCVESVAWITERKNVLSAALALGSLWVWLPFALDEAPRPLGEGRRRYAVASALFGLALLAKTAVCTLPGVLLLIRWWRRGPLRWADALPLAPWFAASLALGSLTARLEREAVGATGADWALTPVERALVAGRAIWFYAGKIVLPLDLSFIYPRWTLSPAEPLQALAPLAAAAALLALFAGRDRIGRGPFAAAAAFVGVLSPALGFFDVYATVFSYVADHWAYHAALVAVAALTHGASRVLDRAPSTLRAAVPVVIAATLLGLTRAQAALYADQVTLYQDTLVKNPGSVMAHANLGVALMARGETGDGLAHLAQAHRLDPDDEVVAVDLAMALELLGRDGEAAAQYEAVIARDPAQGVALNALAGLRTRSRDPAVRDPTRAVALAERALALSAQPPPEVWATLARAYSAAGRTPEAHAAAIQGLERAKAEGNTRMVKVLERMLR